MYFSSCLRPTRTVCLRLKVSYEADSDGGRPGAHASRLIFKQGARSTMGRNGGSTRDLSTEEFVVDIVTDKAQEAIPHRASAKSYNRETSRDRKMVSAAVWQNRTELRVRTSHLVPASSR